MLLDKVRSTIKENELLSAGDSVICAVSGGADSVCLLHVMLALRREYELNIVVANVNHLLRGKESDEDSAFVKAICRAADLKLYYREYDVKKEAQERKIGEEECGRILRYEFFEEISEKLPNAKIATAHNLNDNAETIIFRLVRGTASQGMCGIKYKRKNIIRPLLDVTREEIEKYLRAGSISWREDSTNKIPIYARNKIRLCVTPVLNEITPDAQEKIVSCSKIIACDNEFIAQSASELEKACLMGNELILGVFKKAHISLKRRVLYSVLEKWGAKEITAEKIEKFLDFTALENGKSFDINSDCFAQKSYDRIVLCHREEKAQFHELIDVKNPVFSPQWSLQLYVSDKKVKKSGNNMAVFDADKLPLPLEVSYRKPGDRIRIKGLEGSKKINDVFSDEKIMHHLRDEIPIVKSGDDVIYIAGLRQSALYADDENTKRYIVIEYERKAETKDE